LYTIMNQYHSESHGFKSSDGDWVAWDSTIKSAGKNGIQPDLAILWDLEWVDFTLI
jgi:hypothetical protein